MGTDQNNGGSKANTRLDWQICTSDDEWNSSLQDALPISLPTSPGKRMLSWIQRRWHIGSALLLLLVAGALWAWHDAEKGVAQIKSELRESVAVDLWTTTGGDAQEKNQLYASLQGEIA